MHEVIAPAGRILHSDIAIEHRRGKAWRPGPQPAHLPGYGGSRRSGSRGRNYYARELYYHAAYQQAADVFEAFLAEGRGWVEKQHWRLPVYRCAIISWAKGRKQLQALLRSFVYDAPRAGRPAVNLFYQRRMFETAVFWYQTALSRPMT